MCSNQEAAASLTLYSYVYYNRNYTKHEEPLLVLEIGRWWGTDNACREQAEIDIVALCDDGSMICGECKWQAKQTDVEVLRTLQHRASLIGKADEQRLFLFSKSGFTDACQAEAAACSCRLVSLANMGMEQ